MGGGYIVLGKGNANKILVKKLKGRNYMEELYIDGNEIFRWISKN
jgi:hypothetical protein